MSLLARLIEAGTPADLIAEVAKELARAEVAQEAIEARRAADRERQQRRRDNVTSRDTVDVTAAPPLSRPPNEINSNPPTHTHPDITPVREADPFPKPEWCESRQVWADFKANRKAKRLPCTPTAHAKLLRDIDRLTDDEWPPGKLFEAIVARGWAAAYDPREPANDRNQRPLNQRSTTRESGERVAARYTAAGGRAAHLLPGPGSPGGDA